MSRYRPRGIHGQTVEILASRILSNEYPEGATLDLTTLRAELDVSLTALREALKVLSAKGMIDARQKRGTFVQPRTSWNMLDADVMRWHTTGEPDPGLFDQLTEVRAVVEPAAARMAAERATESDLTGLSSALDAMVEASDVDTEVAADIAFHHALLLATHNDFLAQIAQIIAIGLAERDKFVHHATSSNPVPSHRAVLDAVVAHDPVAAERAMRALVDQSMTDLKNAGDNRLP
ncbi:FadR/GntR family transcriptional regulator [Actinophytocola oryzae]|uniref:DNA-binding FadR family transcriptional regulator n=1 Tax=Actinophytocola oryzae TaxID=502181 RepID=A0A4R7US89_9PSEU|nr:FadR/GntR family transcriptional regulator [Actinophytocola oryzae]TDV38628.1 DNA-binding FadR family transcriptional regulator [Actinophytocola oryzae]